MSMSGYSVKVWAIKNKGDLKLILVAAVAVVTFFVAKIQPPELNVAISGVVAAVVKLIADGIDYYLSDHPV